MIIGGFWTDWKLVGLVSIFSNCKLVISFLFFSTWEHIKYLFSCHFFWTQEHSVKVHPFTTTKFPHIRSYSLQHPLMANVAFQLQPNFNFNPLFQQTFRSPPLRSLPIKLSFAFKLNYSSYKMIRYSPKLRVECFFMSPKPKGENVIGGIGSLEDNDHNHSCTALAASSGVGSTVGLQPSVGDELGFGASMMMLGSILTVVAFCLVVFNTERKSVLKLQVLCSFDNYLYLLHNLNYKFKFCNE